MSTGRSGARPVLAGCRIIVSEVRAAGASLATNHAAGVDELGRALGAAGADVMRVSASRSMAPAPAVMRRAVHRAGSGGADAVLFASSSVSWIEAAASTGALEAIRRRADADRFLLIAKDEEEVRRLQGVRLPARLVEPEAPTGLAGCVVAHYGSGRGSLLTDAGSLQVRSGGVVLDGRFLPLSRGAVGLIEALFLARGRVLSRGELGQELPGGERSGRAVEVAVARLRESLGGIDLIQTVVKRGYRLAVSEP
ncbi:winged helix-turn-helix domain-containing protein [Microbacterium sp. NPDC091662]|uniref:winged helix-turn-helix domain-containing protein n=1 Tax=Microbacterium sp. NPDC091662 TaxID=3364211 RepID=UPI0037F43B43